MGADKENEYFSDGLAEEIINFLAQIPGLKVIARTSAFAFKGKERGHSQDRRQRCASQPSSKAACGDPGIAPPRHGAAHQRRRRLASLVAAL